MLLSIIVIIILSYDKETSQTFIKPGNPLIRYIGRFDSSQADRVRFDWPGVQIQAVFSGTSCSIILEDGKNDYNVFIDKKFHKVLQTTSDTLYTLASNLHNKKHTLLITKRTEASFGIASFRGFILDPDKSLHTIVKKNKRKIEFIGDSFVAGFGNEGNSSDCLFSRETENNYIAYGPVLARRLKADYSIIAISGIGIVKNFGDSIRTSEFPLPYYYDRVCLNDTLLWDFNHWQPDIVVVRLGRNDYWKKPHPKREMFITAYLNFLKKLRGYYPGAHIFALCGPVRKDPHCVYIQSTVNEMQKKLNDKRMHFIKLDVNLDPKKDFGCQKHPNESGHKKIADALEPIFKKVLRW